MPFTIDYSFVSSTDAGRRVLLGRAPRQDITISFSATAGPLPTTWDFLGRCLLERTDSVVDGVFYEQPLYRGLNAYFIESVIRELVNPSSAECFNVWLISVPWLPDGTVQLNSRGTPCTT